MNVKCGDVVVLNGELRPSLIFKMRDYDNVAECVSLTTSDKGINIYVCDPRINKNLYASLNNFETELEKIDSVIETVDLDICNNICNKVYGIEIAL